MKIRNVGARCNYSLEEKSPWSNAWFIPIATETVFRRMLETFPRILYKVKRRSNITEGQPADKCNLDGVCNIKSHQNIGSLLKTTSGRCRGLKELIAALQHSISTDSQYKTSHSNCSFTSSASPWQQHKRTKTKDRLKDRWKQRKSDPASPHCFTDALDDNKMHISHRSWQWTGMFQLLHDFWRVQAKQGVTPPVPDSASVWRRFSSR